MCWWYEYDSYASALIFIGYSFTAALWCKELYEQQADATIISPKHTELGPISASSRQGGEYWACFKGPWLID